MRVAVVGAGAVGLCCALALAEEGAEVTLFDRGLPGAANSTLTGGGIRQQFGTDTNIALSRLAAPLWQDFARRFGVDPHFKPIGYLFLAHGEDGAAVLRDQVQLQNRNGVDSEYLDASNVARRWPSLAGRGIVAGGFRQGDGWANQHRIIDGLIRGALGAGVTIEAGCGVVALSRWGGAIRGVETGYGTQTADAVVLATGAWTDLLTPLGLSVPLQAKRHELLIVEPSIPVPRDMPWLIGVRDQIHVRPDLPGRALVGGFMGHDDSVPPGDFETRADGSWSRQVLRAVTDVFGVVGRDARILQGWAGLYPSTPDRHPVIDRLAPGLYVALGFSGTGLMHAPAAGLLVTELVRNGRLSSIGGQQLSANRFASRGPAERTGF